MRLAIVGSVSLWGNRKASEIIYDAIAYFKPSKVVSGGALGIDTMAELIAKECFDVSVTVYRPSQQSWPFFKERNLLIAKDCDVLLRVVASTSKTYGSGWTRDRAKEMGVRCYERVIDL